MTVAEGAIHCTVVSPERPLFEGNVDHLVVPGIEGELGIYPRHAPLIGALGPGVVRLSRGGTIERYAIRDGFVHVKKNVVTLVVSDAVKVTDTDVAAVESELAAVIEALRSPKSAEEFEELQQRRRWCEVRRSLLSRPTPRAARTDRSRVVSIRSREDGDARCP